jgi:glycerol-3-phosphate acyltransferase PlsY
VWLGLAVVTAAYLVGSVSLGLAIARHKGVDLRSVGSGNLGATNVGRALGKPIGRVVLALDALKGAVPTLGAVLLFGSTSPWTAATGIAVVVGHLWPLWHGLRGGKGAATGLGVMLVVVPLAGAIAGLGYVVGKQLSRRASVGSLLGTLCGGTATVGWELWQAHGLTARSAMAGILLALIVVAHAPNLARLARGQEPPS